MAKPFTSLDGVDARGVRAEVHVQTGTGTVKALEENGKNILVKMNVEGLRHPVQGWTSKDQSIYPLLVAAHEQKREVSYRIESQRKDGIDRTTPIADLRKTPEDGAKNTKQIFVGIDGTLSAEALTNPEEDPLSGGRVSALNPRNAPQPQGSQAGGAPTGGGLSVEQALAGLTKARQGGLPESVCDAAVALALAAGASVDQVINAGQSTEQRREQRRAFASEGKPFHQYNSDGRVNFGSYAMQAAVGAESLAADLMMANNVAVAAAHNAAVDAGEIAGEHIEPAAVDFKNAAALGALLLNLADQVQVDAIGGGRPDRMATSHTRARGLVYDAVKTRHPVPFGNAEAQEAWGKAVVAEATLRLRYAAAIADPTAAENQNQQAQGQNQQAQGQNQQGGQVHQIAQQRKVPVEGDEGFTAPSDETIARFAALAQAAGFDGSPESPIIGYLTRTFGVGAVRKVHGPALDTMLAWYEEKGIEPGAEGAVKFHDKVLAAVAEPESA